MPRLSEKQREWFYNVGLPGMYLKLGEETLKLAKSMAPVNTGMLKDSGEVIANQKGFKIRFTVPYAYQVHEGKRQYLTSRYVMNSPAHLRNTAKGLVPIKAHKKTFKPGYKPIKSKSGGWYTKDMTEVPPSQPFLQTAWNKIYKKQPRDIQRLLPKSISIYEVTT